MTALGRSLLACLALSGLGAIGAAQAAQVFVDGNAAPWSTSINPTFDFGSGTPLPPAVIEGSVAGFGAGDVLDIRVLSGSVSVFPSAYPFVDADGVLVTPGTDPGAYVGPVDDALGDSGKGFPSRYTPADWGTALGALMGTFANANGVIVGTPFEVGSSRTVTVPVGATRIQFGINDDVFPDNGGGFEVSVAVVPEPGTVALMAAGLGLLAASRVRRKA